MVPRENKNNAYAKFRGTNKEYYGIFRNGLSEARFHRMFRMFYIQFRFLPPAGCLKASNVH